MRPFRSLAWTVAASALLLTGTVAGLAPRPVLAQDPGADEEQPVEKVDFSLSAAEVAPGGSVDVVAAVTIAPGWHIYGLNDTSALPTAMVLAEGSPFTPGTPSESPAPKEKIKEHIGKELHHYDEVTFRFPVKVPVDMEAGATEVSGLLTYMPCTDEHCLLPAEVPFKLPLTVLAKADGDPDPPIDAPQTKVRIIRAEVVGGPVKAGASFQVDLELEMDAGWHLYAQSEPEELGPPAFEWQLPDDWTVGAVEDVSTAHELEQWGEKHMVHEGKLVVRQVLTAGASASGTVKIGGVAGWQVCNDSMCVREMDVPFQVAVAVTPSAAGADVSNEPDRTDPGARVPPVLAEKALFPAGGLPRGAEVTVEISLTIASGYELSKLDTEWTDQGRFEVGEIEMVRTKGQALVRQSIRVKDQAPFGVVPGEVRLLWTAMPTDGRKLLVAGEDYIEAPFEVVSPGLTLGMLLLAFGGGIVTLITPCVLPLLPVTVSYFAKQQGNPLPRSIAYAAGIIVTITGVGLIFSTAISQFAAGWPFNLFMTVVFLALALSLFGVFELSLPGFLVNKTTNLGGSGGVVGAFFMAVTLALVSFSCSAPVLLLLFSDFESGAYVTSLVLLLVYSGTMAAPFFACSLFPAFLNKMPKAGGWMQAVKVTMGFVEFGLAFKFLRSVGQNLDIDIVPRTLVIAIWVACCLLAGIYLLGHLGLGYESKPDTIGVGRMLTGMMFLTFAFYLVPGTFKMPLASYIEAFLVTQPNELIVAGAGGGSSGVGAGGKGDGAHASGTPAAHHEWPRNDWDGALQRATRDKRPALFDFTGVG